MASTDSIQYQLQHYNDDKGPAVIAGSVILISIATTVVVLRLVARRIAGTTWRADDYSIIASLVGLIPSHVMVIVAERAGTGFRLWHVCDAHRMHSLWHGQACCPGGPDQRQSIP